MKLAIYGEQLIRKDDEIRDIVVDSPDLEDAVSSLISRANYYGGNDNISVIIISI